MNGSALSEVLDQPLVAAVVVLLALIGMVLWLLVPFAVFGAKSLLRQQRQLLGELLAEQRRTNALLQHRSMGGGLTVTDDFAASPSVAGEAKDEPVLALPREAEATAVRGPAPRRRREGPGPSLTVDKADRVR